MDPISTSTDDDNIVIMPGNEPDIHGDKYVPIRDATVLTSITPQLLRKYADDGTIKSYKTPSGHRRFSYDDLQRIKSKSSRKSKAVQGTKSKHVIRINYIYVRAATEEAIQSQVRFIMEQDVDRSDHVIVSDVGVCGKQGKGTMTLIESCLRGAVGDVVVAHRDRLDRSTYSMMNFMVHRAGGKLVSLDAETFRATDIELADEMFAVLQKYRSNKKTNMNRDAFVAEDDPCENATANTVVAPKKRRGRPPRVVLPQVIEA